MPPGRLGRALAENKHLQSVWPDHCPWAPPVCSLRSAPRPLFPTMVAAAACPRASLWPLSPAGRSSGQTGRSQCVGRRCSPAGQRARQQLGANPADQAWEVGRRGARAGCTPCCHCPLPRQAGCVRVCGGQLACWYSSSACFMMRSPGIRRYCRAGGGKEGETRVMHTEDCTWGAPAAARSRIPTGVAASARLRVLDRPPTPPTRKPCSAFHMPQCLAPIQPCEVPACEPRFCISSVLSGAGAQRVLRLPSTPVTCGGCGNVQDTADSRRGSFMPGLPRSAGAGRCTVGLRAQCFRPLAGAACTCLLQP